MTYPIPVMKIAADAPLFHYSHMETWQSLYQMQLDHENLTSLLARKAATEITNRFMMDVLRRERIEMVDDPDGKRIRFTCVALRQDQLLDLLYAAYREGQSDAIKRAPVAFVG